jgi:hypothetical protein
MGELGDADIPDSRARAVGAHGNGDDCGKARGTTSGGTEEGDVDEIDERCLDGNEQRRPGRGREGDKRRRRQRLDSH